MINIKLKFKNKIGLYLYSLKELIENKNLSYLLKNLKNIDDFNFVIFKKNKKIKMNILKYCIHNNNFNALKYLYNVVQNKIVLDQWNEPFSYCLIDYASQHNLLNVIIWLYTYKKEITTDNAISLASQSGHLNCVIYLNQKIGCKCLLYALNISCSRGYLITLNYLCKTFKKKPTDIAIYWCDEKNNLYMLMYLKIKGFKIFNKTQLFNIKNKKIKKYVSKYLCID